MALGSTITFPIDSTLTSITEDPTGVTVTPMKAAHITELRAAVDKVRSLAGLSAATYTYNVALNGLIHVEDVRELRQRLGDALTALGIQLPNYTDSTIKGFSEDPLNATLIKAAHIRELRQAATKGGGTGGGEGGGSAPNIHWLVSDQLGTPRMVFDQSGSLTVAQNGQYVSGMTRHDYLPFGEELFAGTGGRTTAQGSVGDSTRQHFTQKERDNETGLDYFGARYYSSTQGRFTSFDPLIASARSAEPQSWNRYTYCINNPLVLVDPDGLDWGVAEWDDEDGVHHINYEYFSGEVGERGGRKYSPVNFGELGYADIETTYNGTVRISNDPAHLQESVPPVNFGDILRALGTAFYNASTPGFDDEFFHDYSSRMAGLDPQTGEPSCKGCPLAGTLFVLPELPEGSFSIADWTGYPAEVPRPVGPFRLLEGEEYAAARSAADAANKAMHRADPGLGGMHIHEIQPVKFGGSPVDPLNKIGITPSLHSRYSAWWSGLQRALERKQ